MARIVIEIEDEFIDWVLQMLRMIQWFIRLSSKNREIKFKFAVYPEKQA